MRNVRHKVGFELCEGHLFAHHVFCEHESTDDHQRKNTEDDKTVVNPDFAKFSNACPLILYGESQWAKDIFELSHHLRFSLVCPNRLMPQAASLKSPPQFQ